MAKKSKRSRSGSPKSKKSRPGAGPGQAGQFAERALSQSAAGGQALATSEPLRDVPEATSGEQTRAPESERRRRAAGILPPPHDSLQARDAEPSDPAFDEVSIPPVTSPAFADSSASGDVNELEDSFFVRRAAVESAQAHAGQHHDLHDEVDRQVDPRTAQKMTAAAQARRVHLTRYVKWAVGVSAAVCLIGLGRFAFKGKQEFAPPPPIIHTAMAAVVDTTPHSIAARDPNAAAVPAPTPATTEESQAAADQAVAALDNAAAPANAVPATDAVQAAPAADPAQKPADPAAAVQAAAPPAAVQAQPAVVADAPAAAPAAAPVSEKTAAQEKKASSQALERGNAKAAIEAGERSVALDPTDGEAWLVLGAAYQQIGKNADAKRCFNSCIKEGKHGPISECRAMLQ